MSDQKFYQCPRTGKYKAATTPLIKASMWPHRVLRREPSLVLLASMAGIACTFMGVFSIYELGWNPDVGFDKRGMGMYPWKKIKQSDKPIKVMHPFPIQGNPNIDNMETVLKS